MTWKRVYTKQAKKDAKTPKAAGLQSRTEALLALIAEDPWRTPPPYHSLLGDLTGAVSRRINFQHRLVYQVVEDQKIIKMLRLWSHYE